MNTKRLHKSLIALAAGAALVTGYAATTSVNAAAPHSNPLASPVQQPGCYSKELLEVKNNPSVGSTTVGVIYSGVQVNLIGRSGAWTNLWAYTPGPYGYYMYVQGWTKGKVGCK
jgi:hypothetical protein